DRTRIVGARSHAGSMRIGIDDHLLRPARGDGLLARVAQERGEPRDVRPRPDRLRAAPDGRHGQGESEGEDEERDDQLQQGEAPDASSGPTASADGYLAVWSHEVTSAFSPSPPGALSAPSDHRS